MAKSDHRAETAFGAQNPAATDDGLRTGFLLRSEVVSGWPGLVIDGFSDQGGNDSVKLVRMELLGAGVLLCIFAGAVARVDIHQKPEMLHFGFHKSDDGKFSKKLRDSAGETSKIEIRINQWSSESLRILNVAALASDIAAKLPTTSPPSPFTSAQFGLQMVEGVERVIYIAAK